MPFAPMKRLSSILLSFALLSPAPSAIAQPLASPATSHDEVTLAELIAQLNALLVQLNAYLQANNTATSTSIGVPTTPSVTPDPVTIIPTGISPPVTTDPTNTTSTVPTIISNGPTIIGNRATGSIGIYDYGMWSVPGKSTAIRGITIDELSADLLRRHNEFNADYEGRDFDLTQAENMGYAHYQSDDGFEGFYRHSNGNTGTIISDVQLSLFLGIKCCLGLNNEVVGAGVTSLKIGVDNPIIIEGVDLGTIDGLIRVRESLSDNGTFNTDSIHSSSGLSSSLGFVFENEYSSSGYVKGAFSDQITPDGNPERAAGEVRIWWTDKGFSSNRNDRENSLVGVFVADVEE